MREANQSGWVRIGEAVRLTKIPRSTLIRLADRGLIPVDQRWGRGTWRLIYLPALLKCDLADSRANPRSKPTRWVGH